ncbi:MAG: hypothetical protein KDA80_20770 [Planctomycetaceae bacterium]|nr:hypothetical protein [Planctomycetaceae bacterium]
MSQLTRLENMIVSAKSLKAADKQSILKKVVAEAKKRYGASLPKQAWPTFETLLFAVLVEDVTHEQAERAYTRMTETFFDLNEIRVSSVTEIEQSLGEIDDASWKAMRVREALQHTFEKHYAYDLEQLRRKTQDQAQKELEEIPHQTPFIRSYTLQQALGSHVLPIDQTMHAVLVWLGFGDADSTPESAADDLKSAVKKADAPLVCHLLKCLATDPELKEHFAEFDPSDEELDPHQAGKRLAELFKNPKKKSKTAQSSKKTIEAKSSKKVSKKRPTKKKTSRPSTSGHSSKPSDSKNKVSKKVTKKKPTKKKTARKS